MTRTMGEPRDIDLVALRLDVANPRLAVQAKDHRGATVQMLARFQSEIVRLAQDIERRGLDGGDLPIVAPYIQEEKGLLSPIDGIYTVYDGNRRILAIQMLEDPSRFKDYLSPQNHDHFLRLSANPTRDPFRAIRCLVMPNETGALELARLRHGGSQEGVGREEWGAFEKVRFEARIHPQKSPPHFRLFVLARDQGLLSEDVEVAVQSGKRWFSTFKRIVTSKTARGLIGFTIQKKEVSFEEEQDIVLRRLASIIHRLATKALDVDSLRDKEQIADAIDWEIKNISSKEPNPFRRGAARPAPGAALGEPPAIETVAPQAPSDPTEGTSEAGQQRANSPAPSEGGGDDGSPSGERAPRDAHANSNGMPNGEEPPDLSPPRLIGKAEYIARGVNITGAPQRVTAIVYELQRLRLAGSSTFPNTCMLALRVVIEFTLKDLAAAYGMNVKGEDDDGRPSLGKYYGAVYRTLTDGPLDPLKKRVKTKQNAARAAIEKLNEYMHQSELHATADSVKGMWHDIEPILEASWRAMAEKRKPE